MGEGQAPKVERLKGSGAVAGRPASSMSTCAGSIDEEEEDDFCSDALSALLDALEDDDIDMFDDTPQASPAGLGPAKEQAAQVVRGATVHKANVAVSPLPPPEMAGKEPINSRAALGFRPTSPIRVAPGEQIGSDADDMSVTQSVRVCSECNECISSPRSEKVLAEIELQRQSFLSARSAALAEAQAKKVEALQRLQSAEEALAARKERTVELESGLESWLVSWRQNEMQKISSDLGGAHKDVCKLTERKKELERWLSERKVQAQQLREMLEARSSGMATSGVLPSLATRVPAHATVASGAQVRTGAQIIENVGAPPVLDQGPAFAPGMERPRSPGGPGQLRNPAFGPGGLFSAVPGPGGGPALGAPPCSRVVRPNLSATSASLARPGSAERKESSPGIAQRIQEPANAMQNLEKSAHASPRSHAQGKSDSDTACARESQGGGELGVRRCPAVGAPPVPPSLTPIVAPAAPARTSSQRTPSPRQFRPVSATPGMSNSPSSPAETRSEGSPSVGPSSGPGGPAVTHSEGNPFHASFTRRSLREPQVAK